MTLTSELQFLDTMADPFSLLRQGTACLCYGMLFMSWSHALTTPNSHLGTLQSSEFWVILLFCHQDSLSMSLPGS